MAMSGAWVAKKSVTEARLMGLFVAGDPVSLTSGCS
jgi:hypothetical protein